jgi:hypothetical protein
LISPPPLLGGFIIWPNPANDAVAAPGEIDDERASAIRAMIHKGVPLRQDTNRSPG